MPRSSRLHDLLVILRDGRLHRAEDLAAQLGVSMRTIYRDMDTLRASGIPVEGARGVGFRATEAVTLPPLTLAPDEWEALMLGVAIVAEAADEELRDAAERLTSKLDMLVPEQGVAPAEQWKFATYPFADSTRSLRHMGVLRRAIRARQKLRLRHRDLKGGCIEATMRPLHLEHWGRVWLLTSWNETSGDFAVLRLDLIEEATALPDFFVDEPGKRYEDHAP